MKNQITQPSLLAPGAPLPLLHRLLLRYYIGPFVAQKAQWQPSRAHFSRVSSKILALVEGLPREFWDKKVLVPPQKGLEDSSRFWSVNETLEHMSIVGMAVCKIIEDLGADKESSLVVSTAAAKPKGLLTSESSFNEFKHFVDFVNKDLDTSINNRNSIKTCEHPWFGAFGIQQWNWLLGTHQSIHYLQLKNIIKGATPKA